MIEKLIIIIITTIIKNERKKNCAVKDWATAHCIARQGLYCNLGGLEGGWFKEKLYCKMVKCIARGGWIVLKHGRKLYCRTTSVLQWKGIVLQQAVGLECIAIHKAVL